MVYSSNGSVMVRSEVESEGFRHADHHREAAAADGRTPCRRARPTDAFEGVVGTAAGHLLERFDDIFLGGKRIGGTELLRHLQFRVEGVDRDDFFRPGDARPLDDRETDAAAAEDRDRRPWRDFRGVEHCADPSGDTAADQRGAVERDLRIDADQVLRRDGGVLSSIAPQPEKMLSGLPAVSWVRCLPASGVVSALPCSRHSTGRPATQKRHLPHM